MRIGHRHLIKHGSHFRCPSTAASVNSFLHGTRQSRLARNATRTGWIVGGAVAPVMAAWASPNLCSGQDSQNYGPSFSAAFTRSYSTALTVS
jgi:hypothetical protein